MQIAIVVGVGSSGPSVRLKATDGTEYATELTEELCAEMCSAFIYAAAFIPGIDMAAFGQRVEMLTRAKREAHDRAAKARSKDVS